MIPRRQRRNRMVFVFGLISLMGLIGVRGIAFAGTEEPNWIRTTEVTIQVDTAKPAPTAQPQVTAQPAAREAATVKATTAAPKVSPSSGIPESAESSASKSSAPAAVESPSHPAPSEGRDVESANSPLPRSSPDVP